MEKFFNETYDSVLASCLYGLYETGDDSVLDDLMRCMFPLIRRTALRLNRGRLMPDHDYLEAEALNKVYEKITEKVVDNESPGFFTVQVARWIKDCFVWNLRKGNQQVFDYRKAAKVPYQGYFFENMAYIESKLFTTQVVAEIRKAAKQQVRFINEERKACFLMIDSLLGFSDINVKFARRRFSIRRERFKFLYSYTTVLVKAALYDSQYEQHKSGALSLEWETSGGVLCLTSELG